MKGAFVKEVRLMKGGNVKEVRLTEGGDGEDPPGIGFVNEVMLMKGVDGEDLPGRGLGGGREANGAPAHGRHQDEVPAQVRHPETEVVCDRGGIGLHDDHPDEGCGAISY